MPTASTTMSKQQETGAQPTEILVVNPNSSTVITDALAAALTPHTPPGCTLSFRTGPASAPESILDASSAILSASESYQALLKSLPASAAGLSTHPSSAFLVACFSDHPLVGMLRQAAPNKPAVHLLEAAVIHALSCGAKFGVLTTGRSVVPDIDAGVRRIMGGNSDRYVGTHATGLGVVELQTGNRLKIESLITQGAQNLVGKGADVIILGCAGMVGMESLVRQACADLHSDYANVAVIDGARAGIQVLAGLARSSYRA